MNFGAVPPGEAKWVVGHVTTYEKDQGPGWRRGWGGRVGRETELGPQGPPRQTKRIRKRVVHDSISHSAWPRDAEFYSTCVHYSVPRAYNCTDDSLYSVSL